MDIRNINAAIREWRLASEEHVVWKKGPWSREEDELLLKFVVEYGPKKWNLVRERTGLARDGKSCVQRYQTELDPNLLKTPFSPQEEQLVVRLQKEYGNKWVQIAKHLPGRSGNAVKNCWYARKARLERRDLPLYSEHIKPEHEIRNQEEAHNRVSNTTRRSNNVSIYNKETNNIPPLMSHRKRQYVDVDYNNLSDEVEVQKRIRMDPSTLWMQQQMMELPNSQQPAPLDQLLPSLQDYDPLLITMGIQQQQQQQQDIELLLCSLQDYDPSTMWMQQQQQPPPQDIELLLCSLQDDTPIPALSINDGQNNINPKDNSAPPPPATANYASKLEGVCSSKQVGKESHHDGVFDLTEEDFAKFDYLVDSEDTNYALLEAYLDEVDEESKQLGDHVQLPEENEAAAAPEPPRPIDHDQHDGGSEPKSKDDQLEQDLWEILEDPEKLNRLSRVLLDQIADEAIVRSSGHTTATSSSPMDTDQINRSN